MKLTRSKFLSITISSGLGSLALATIWGAGRITEPASSPPTYPVATRQHGLTWQGNVDSGLPPVHVAQHQASPRTGDAESVPLPGGALPGGALPESADFEVLPPPPDDGAEQPAIPPARSGEPASEPRPGGEGLFGPPPTAQPKLPAPPPPPHAPRPGYHRSPAPDDDDLLTDDLLIPGPTTPAAPHGKDRPKNELNTGAGSSSSGNSATPAEDPHAALFAREMYPSAQECRTCHETIYEEWASSSHAYAAISPMFQKFEQTITNLSMGTVGYFCMRCHSPVGTTIGYPRHESIWNAIPAAREGVTCIVCHRVRYNYTKTDGERRIEPGSVFEPVYGAGYGETLARVLDKKDHYKVKTSADEKGPGQNIHTEVIHFEQIKTSHICASCHQVAVEPGIKLEVVWEQYRASPACKMGISCQDCHMGKEPGVPAGYATAPVAVVGGKKIDPDRKHSNHLFYGPGYSIAHPGLFPFNPKAETWTAEQWLQFDYRAGWGTKEFEDHLHDHNIQLSFPKVWNNADDRMDAREIVDANVEKLVKKMHMRKRLMENTSRVAGPVFANTPLAGQDLVLHYLVTNLNSGHNMPSGSLGAQPQIWLNVALVGPRGNRLWESGYVDNNGDMADLHSLEVAAGRIPRDQQLFNLQTKFLITHVKGPDREMYLPINTDIDQLPFLRPSPFPVRVMNHPPFIRMEGHSLSPYGSRKAKYRIPGHLLAEPGLYRLSVRMRSRAEPIYFMRFCGATPEMERNMNAWMLDFNENSTEFWVR